MIENLVFLLTIKKSVDKMIGGGGYNGDIDKIGGRIWMRKRNIKLC
jgi:hypothetical protein